MTTESIVVLIVGAGPAGLATSSCLNIQKIPNIVLEMEDCCASLWKKHSYDPLNLHLAKNFCELPHLPFPLDAPTFMSKSDFTQYLDNYVAHFQINPLYGRVVYSANFNADDGKWLVQVKNKLSRRAEEYVAKFLVVATGENSGGFIPLSNYGGKASIVIRNLGDESLFNEEGMPKKMKPNHWKGDNGLYCAGFSSFGLFGISKDAKMIADDIASHFKNAKPRMAFKP